MFKRSNVQTFRRGLLLAAVVGLPVASLAMHWRAADVSDDREAERTISRALDGAAPGALIVTQGDQATFWLWYGLYAEGRRPDVAVLSAPLLSYGWYRDELRRRYPDLAVMEPAEAPHGLVRSTIEANAGRRTVYAADPPDEWGGWFHLAVDEVSGLYRIAFAQK